MPRRKLCIMGCAAIAVALMSFAAPMAANAEILIDMDGDTNLAMTTMSGYTRFNDPAGLHVSGAPILANAICDITDTLADTGYNVDVRVNMNRHKTRTVLTTGDAAAVALSDLLFDYTGLAKVGASNSMDFGTLGLTFDTAGLYSVTLYHHASGRASSAEADIVLTDADGARASQAIDSSYGANPAQAAHTETYTVRSDGSSEITLVYTHDATNNGYAFPINGMAIEVPEPATMSMLFMAIGGLALMFRRRR